ncbi:DNA-3-methyladenine glycosylase I [Georgenia faecalis]|uniref:DNA-3-methyladenine glycosylase I n=1 Tax=Georgenia faecalis TaxID=2483799 RepID=UPI000FDC876B|nr:DNA-3-methyladenine glycosylase I [Georgenia faecalis]
MRCFGDGDPLYERYHDEEWGRPLADGDDDERALFERISLEAFQSGLSWLVVLRKREAFREAFRGFDPHAVAAFTDDDVDRLLADAGIIRNRAKIEATIANARALLALHDRGETLAGLLARHAPPPREAPPAAPSQVPSATAESHALAKELRGAGFRFVGPTTAYATMQAVGVVDDHLATCDVRASARG